MPNHVAEGLMADVRFIVVAHGPKELDAVCRSLERGGMKRRYARVDAKKPLLEREFIVWEM